MPLTDRKACRRATKKSSLAVYEVSSETKKKSSYSSKRSLREINRIICFLMLLSDFILFYAFPTKFRRAEWLLMKVN